MMRSRLTIFIVVVSVIVVVAATGAFAAGNRSLGRKAMFSGGAERLDGGTLALDVKAPFERAVLTVNGPQGFAIQREYAAGKAIALQLADEAGAPLANGRYSYTLRLSPRPENGSGFERGMFFVRDGAAVSRNSLRAELGQTRNALNLERGKQRRSEQRPARAQRAGAVKRAPQEARPGGDPSATYDYYGTVAIWDTYPSLYFYHYYDSGYYYAGRIYGAAYYGYSLYSYGYDWNNMYGGFGNWLSAIVDWINAYGFSLYGSRYIGGFTGIYSYAYDVGFNDGTYFRSGLYVTPFGVGVQTLDPTADLEVYDYNSYAALRLNNYNAVWAFSNTPGGVFTVNKIGSGGQEFSVRTRNNGDGQPTMQVQGTVAASGGFVNTSTRSAKTDFADLDGKEVLNRLAEVPIMSWRYKQDGTEAVHVGPTAEDFQAAFQLGDGKTISTIDADGVALAAIQGLNSMLEEKDQEIADLTKRLAALEELLQARSPGDS